MALDWDREVDVAIVGSGAAGFTAALTAHAHGLRVEMFEKTDPMKPITETARDPSSLMPSTYHQA